MFICLSDSKKVTHTLTVLSAEELTMATANINTLDKRLSVPAIELLDNRKKQGKLFIDSTINSHIIAGDNLELSTLLLNETALINFVSRLCLSEAILVRDTLINSLDIIEIRLNERIAKKDTVQKLRSRLLAHQHNNITKDLHPSNTINNVTPIHLLEVKQRLANALKAQKAKSIAIKDKLNTQLSNNTDPGKHAPITAIASSS